MKSPDKINSEILKDRANILFLMFFVGSRGAFRCDRMRQSVIALSAVDQKMKASRRESWLCLQMLGVSQRMYKSITYTDIYCIMNCNVHMHTKYKIISESYIYILTYYIIY